MNIFVVVFIVYIVALLIIGAIAAKKKTETATDFFVAGRSMSMWVVAGTYGASFLSAGSFLGTLGYNYRFGLAAGWQLIGTLTCMFCLAIFFAKKFWRFGYYNNACTMPDLIGKRYPSKFGRGFYSVMILCIYTVGMASMYMGFDAVLSLVSDIPYMTGIIIGAVVVMIYTWSGGARAVAWTDTLCMVLMVFAMIVTLTAAISNSGGISELIMQYGQSATPEGQTWQQGDALLSSTNSYLTVGMSAAWFLVWCTGNLCQPHQITRIYLAKNEKHAIYAVTIVMIPFTIVYVAGLLIAAYARVIAPNLAKTDTAFPTVVLSVLPDAVAAVVLVGIISAIISTASTMLLITSQCTSYDIFKKLVKPEASETEVLKISRITIIICSILAVVIAYFARNISGLIFLWSSAFAMMGAGILPSLVGAFYWKRANTQANIASMLVGFVSTAAMYLIPGLMPSWMQHPILPGLVLSIATFVIVALATQRPSDEVLEPFFGEDLKDYSKNRKIHPAK